MHRPKNPQSPKGPDSAKGGELSRLLTLWWDALVHPDSARDLILKARGFDKFDRFLLVGVGLLYLSYGFSMGLFRGLFPALIAGAKLPFLFLFTLLVCFPPLYVLNCLEDLRLSPAQTFRLLLVATSANAAAVASMTPVSLFFTLTAFDRTYQFLVLMHVAFFAFSGFTSMVVISLLFRATAARVGRRLRPGLVVGWGLLYIFVGTQMSWVLRPWIGSLTVPYAAFRPLGGSFFEALWRLIGT